MDARRDQANNGATSSMLRIESLLNPATSEHQDRQMAGPSTALSPPPTPALTSASSAYSPRFDTPEASSPAKRPKLARDAPVFIKGETGTKLHYAPFESSEDTIALAPWQRDELVQQHRRFKIYPSGNEKDGKIGDFTKHFPYSSEKKAEFNKSGLEGFDVFQYKFIVPDDPTKKEHTVMWDYNTGLVRITPFFKACKYSKTTPAKALNTNKGLREMAHSITGGALAAQGYWMPYVCARAICLTFAYPIRWALTPIFGPSFIRECLPPNHPNFARFKIDAEIIRTAEMALDGVQHTPVVTDIPRSASVQQQQEHHHPMRHPHAAKPTFKSGSPFDYNVPMPTRMTNENYGLAEHSSLDSPAISPKNTTFVASGWTSINQQQSGVTGKAVSSTPPSPPPNTPQSSLGSALLREPSYAFQPGPAPSSSRAVKRRRDSSSASGSVYSAGSSRSSSGSGGASVCGGFRATQGSVLPPFNPYREYTAEDFEAAKTLLSVCDSG